MNDDNQPINQQLSNAQGIPAPSGTNENGEPYWVIDGRMVLWAEMQQLLWEAQKSRNSNSGGGSGNLEQMPAMPTSSFESYTPPEGNFETVRSPEQSAERGEQRVETSAERAEERSPDRDPQQSQRDSNTSTPQASVVGDSAKLSSVDTTNVAQMEDYASRNEKGSPNKSSTFLGTLLKKLLLVLSTE